MPSVFYQPAGVLEALVRMQAEGHELAPVKYLHMLPTHEMAIGGEVNPEVLGQGVVQHFKELWMHAALTPPEGQDHCLAVFFLYFIQ